MKTTFIFLICCCLSLEIWAQSNVSQTDNLGVGGDTGIVDLHCHPSLKMYLFDAHFWLPHRTGSGINLFQMQLDTRTLSSNSVKGMIATHYLLERGFVLKSLLRFLVPVMKLFDPTLVAKIANEDYTNFAQINNMLDVLELQLREANIRQHTVHFRLVKSFGEFERAMKEGDIPVAHSIEGGHALGRNMAYSHKRLNAQKKKMELAKRISGSENELFFAKKQMNALPADKRNLYKKYKRIKAPQYYSMYKPGDPAPETNYIQNLDALFARGVCMMAICHFLPNDFTHPTEGISPDGKHLFHAEWKYDPDYDNVPLTPIGKKVIERMFDIGMIVDLTHTNPKARAEILDMAEATNRIRKKEGKEPRPVIFSHCGSQTLFNNNNSRSKDPSESTNYGYYDASDSEILRIKDCKGVIGVIPENFWLAACDKKINKCNCNKDNGIAFIIQTIEHIHQITGDYKNIAIGSDFDGLADAPKDLYNPTQLKALISAMHDSHISDDDIELITHKNALRVLRYGWGN